MRVAIANSSTMSINVLREVVMSNPANRVVWVASSGSEATEKAARSRPDLLLMDLSLSGKDGVQAIRTIMKESPCAILVVTETVRKNAARVFEAMGAGALDAANTPYADAKGTINGAEELLSKIATIERLICGEKQDQKGEHAAHGVEETPFPMVAIGSSTGGPKALADIVSRLPHRLGAPVVIIQHVDKQFSHGLVDWLSGQTGLKVVLAKDGIRPLPDIVFVAGTNDHLVITDDLTFRYIPEPRENPYRPSVDVFLKSLLSVWHPKGIAVLLTGMGRDGADGLLALRRAGWHTIAQDKTTSVVYGMPKAAAEISAASEILPVEDIAAAITRQIALRKGKSP